jgi:hypothetical protein
VAPNTTLPPASRVLGVDDLRRRQLAFQLLDAPLDEALLVLGSVVFGVLAQIALGARLGNGLNDRMALDGLEAVQFFA